MGIGVSIFLLAVGAILAFAVEARPSGIDINVVGWILMAVGALGLVLTLVFWGRARTRVVQQQVVPTVVEREVAPPVVEHRAAPPMVEREIYDDGPPR